MDTDLDKTIASLKSDGAEIITEPNAASWNTEQGLAEFRDSEGNRMVLATGQLVDW